MMKLEQYIALHLAFIVCLSSLMLGMGQDDFILPTLTLVGATVSLWVTDFKKWFHLGTILSNILILLILLASAGYLIRVFDATFGGNLFAIAILRVLVFFQLVLLFRKKENRVCWNIMMVSFLEVIVASVFQQTVIFGLLMILYLFAALTVVTLMHLNREQRYFTQHVYLRSLLRANRKEKPSAQKPLASSETSPRWLPTNEKATFSGSAANLGGMIGIGREFYYRLVITTATSLAVGVLIFFLTPRQDFRIGVDMQRERWRSPAAVSGFLNSVGFTEEIRLGSLGTVLNNPTEIMTVTFAQVNDAAPPNDTNETEYTAIQNQSVYFRGVSLQNYSRGRRSGDDLTIYPNAFNSPARQSDNGSPMPVNFPLSSDQGAAKVERFQDDVNFPIDSEIVRNRLPAAIPLPQERAACRFQPDTQLVFVHCEYLSNAQGTLFAVWPYFFADSRTGSRITLNRDRIVRPQGNFSRRNVALHFMTYSFRNGNQLDLIPCQEPIDLFSLLAFNDEALPSVAKVAQQWDAKLAGKSMIERARNLEHHFLTDNRFYYALGGIARKASLDPLEDFVRDQPGGHCEYFAGALAMMLRKTGIPSRVMVGYRLDTELGHLGQQRYAVRQSDAHSWVEAYIPPHEIPESLRNGPYADWWRRGGWLRLDPTAPLREVMAQSGLWASWKYWATGFWNDYVINFTSDRQESSLYIPISDFFISLKERFFDVNYWKTIIRDVLRRYADIFRSLRQGEWHGSDLVLLGLPPLILLTLVYVIFRVIRRVIRELHSRKLIREQRQRLATVGFYLRFEKILQKTGLIRLPTETQREFARRSIPDLVSMAGYPADLSLTDLPIRVVEAFYRVRYGNVALTSSETDEINAILSRLETGATGRTVMP